MVRGRPRPQMVRGRPRPHPFEHFFGTVRGGLAAGTPPGRLRGLTVRAPQKRGAETRPIMFASKSRQRHLLRTESGAESGDAVAKSVMPNYDSRPSRRHAPGLLQWTR